jgi:hypothetical protein
MKQEKGNILIVIVLLVIVGIILFAQLPELFEGIFGEKETKPKTPSSQPVFEKETTISPPKEEIKQKEQPPEKAKESDSTPPTLLNPRPTGALSAQTRKTYLSLETDEKATCRYSDVSGVYYEYMQHKFSTDNGLFHYALITTLSEGKSYVYYARCMDEGGNKNMEDLVISFRVKEPEDTTPPRRTNAYPQGDVLPVGTSETMIGISTDEPAVCRYDTRAGTDYDSMDYNFSTDKYKKYHTATISGLVDGQAYGFYVRCEDLKGNKNTGDVLIRFQIGL